MKNTPAGLPIEHRGTEDLVEDLCLALRDVGVSDYELPEGERVVSAVLRVQQLHSELSRRGADLMRRLERLSEETSWQMMPLLRDCLMYPDVIPYVRERDGIRRALRCPACRVRELSRSEDSGIWLCDACRAELAAAGVSGLMRVKITLADYPPDELNAQAPLDVVLLREFPGTGFWVAALPKPVGWLHKGNEISVRHLILSPRYVGGRIGRGIRDITVDIAYVLDESLLADASLDFEKYEVVAIGEASDITGAA